MFKIQKIQLHQKFSLVVTRKDSKPYKVKLKNNKKTIIEHFQKEVTKTSNIKIMTTTGQYDKYVYAGHYSPDNYGEKKRHNLVALGRQSNVVRELYKDTDFLNYAKQNSYINEDYDIYYLSDDEVISIFKNYFKYTNLFEKRIDHYVNLIFDANKPKSQSSKIKLFSFPIFQQVFARFELFRALKNSKYCKDLYEILQILCFTRCLSPASLNKCHNTIINKVLQKFNCSYKKLTRAIKELGRNYKKILKEYYKILDKLGLYKTDDIFYDVTNFFFEIPDERYDLLAYGRSKENRKNPIIQVGIAMNSYGIPILLLPFKGNTADCKTMSVALEELNEMGILKDVTIIADKAFNTSTVVYDIAHVRGQKYCLSSKCKGKGASQLIRELTYTHSPFVDSNVAPEVNKMTRASTIHERKVLDSKSHNERIVIEWNHNRALQERVARAACIYKFEGMNPTELNSYTTKNTHSKYLDTYYTDSIGII